MWIAGSPKLEHKQPEEKEREEKKTFIILTHRSELSDRTECDWIATQNLVFFFLGQHVGSPFL